MGAYEVVPEADLAVGQLASPGPLRVGAWLTYTLTITDNGPVDATGLVLTDTLPLSMNVSLLVITPSAGSCGGSLVIVCQLGSLPNGAQVAVTFGGTATSGELVNTATLAGNQFDPSLANNTVSTAVASGWELFLPLVRR